MLGDTSQCTYTCITCFHERKKIVTSNVWGPSEPPERYIRLFWRPEFFQNVICRTCEKRFHWSTSKASLEQLPNAVVHVYVVLMRSYSRGRSAFQEWHNREF